MMVFHVGAENLQPLRCCPAPKSRKRLRRLGTLLYQLGYVILDNKLSWYILKPSHIPDLLGNVESNQALYWTLTAIFTNMAR